MIHYRLTVSRQTGRGQQQLTLRHSYAVEAITPRYATVSLRHVTFPTTQSYPHPSSSRSFYNYLILLLRQTFGSSASLKVFLLHAPTFSVFLFPSRCFLLFILFILFLFFLLFLSEKVSFFPHSLPPLTPL